MKKRLYIFCLWIATASVLLSTVMSHHHHMGRICMVVEQCQEDGNYNDEHTEHHENEQEGCQIHQMHHFVTNAKVVKGVQRLIFDGNALCCAILPYNPYSFIPKFSLVAARWQRYASPIGEGRQTSLGRRGPPAA